MSVKCVCSLTPLSLVVSMDTILTAIEPDRICGLDPRTACTWQGFVNEQEKMSAAFAKVMAKLAVVGQDTSNFVDCSEVVPAATPPLRKSAT